MSTRLNITQLAEAWRKLHEEGRFEEVLAQVLAVVLQLRDSNTELQLRVMKLLRSQFGRKSEKVDAEQLALMLEALTGTPKVEVVPPAPESPLPPPAPKPRKGHGRKPLPKELPHEENLIKVPEAERACPVCGAEKICIGHESSERLEFVPASFKVLVDKREKLACRPCGEQVSIAPTAPKIIDSGLPGPGLLAHVTLSKYKDAIPLGRLGRIYARSGVDLAVSTLADWVAAAAEALRPLASRIEEICLSCRFVQTDDTGLKVLDRDHPAGIKRGHMWVYLGDGRWAAFRYTPDWTADDPGAALAGCTGYVQHDGYAGYVAVHKVVGGLLEVGCWAHARRGFIDCLEAGDVRAAIPLDLIRQLYDVERAADAAGDDHDASRARRQRVAVPVLDSLARWFTETYAREPPKSSLARAIAYAVNRRDALRRYLEDGRINIDNNSSERTLRGIAIGRKNYLFAGSDGAAKNTAVIYSIIATCDLNGVEPWAYLRDVLEKLACGWPHRRLDELLPPNWAAAKREAHQQLPPAAAPVAA